MNAAEAVADLCIARVLEAAVVQALPKFFKDLGKILAERSGMRSLRVHAWVPELCPWTVQVELSVERFGTDRTVAGFRVDLSLNPGMALAVVMKDMHDAAMNSRFRAR